MRFFPCPKDHSTQKNRCLGQNECCVAREQTGRQTHTKVTTEGTLSGFQEFFLQPIMKDRPNISNKFESSEQNISFDIDKGR